MSVMFNLNCETLEQPPRDSLYPSRLIGIEILIKKKIFQQLLYSVIQIYSSSILNISLVKEIKREWKIVEEWKDIENDFYTNDSLNDNL